MKILCNMWEKMIYVYACGELLIKIPFSDLEAYDLEVNVR